MFKGRYNYSVDTKGRTSFPSKFRDDESFKSTERIVLTTALDPSFPHIDIYTFERWNEFETKLASKPLFDENVIKLKRLYVANAVECSLDSHGRILIPATHRQFARIEKEAVFVGMTRTIELWMPEVWEKAQSEAMAQIANVRNGLAGFDL